MKRILVLLCLLVMVGLVPIGPGAFAEDIKKAEPPAKAQKAKAGAVGADTKRGEIVVTATRSHKMAAEVPQAVTFIDGEEINDIGSVNTTDVFQHIPGVAVHDYGSVGFGNQFYVRGYDYLRMYNNLDFQVDGVSIHSEADYGNHILNCIPRAAIDHIEFVRGPAAAMYGQQASIGVINTFIKRPLGSFTGEVTAGYGSWDQKLLSVGLTGSADNLGITLAADLSEGDTFAEHQSFRNRSVLLAPTARLGNKATIEGTILLADRLVNNPLLTYLTKEQAEQDRRQNFDRGELKAEITFVGLGLIYDITDSLQWVTKGGYFYQREKTHIQGDGSGNSWYDFGYDYRTNRPLDSYGITSFVNFSDLGTVGSILTAGVEYHLDDAEQVTSWGGVPDRDSSTKVHNYAVFAQYEWKVIDALTLTGGVRADFFVTDLNDRLTPGDSFSGKEESAISPRVGVTYELFEKFNLFASLGTGFRVPSAYELAAESSLEPEKSMNYEVGVKARIAKIWESTLSFYRTDYKDLIFNWGTIDPVTGVRKSVWSNAGEARFQGIEWANYLNLGWGFKAYAHLLLDDSHFVDYKSAPDAQSPFDYSGNSIPYHPQTQVKMGLEYAHSGWKLGIDGRYYGDYYSDSTGSSKADDYINLDFHASYEYKMVTLSVFLNNILDEDYYTSAWRDMIYPAPGRNIFVMLTFKP